MEVTSARGSFVSVLGKKCETLFETVRNSMNEKWRFLLQKSETAARLRFGSGSCVEQNRGEPVGTGSLVGPKTLDRYCGTEPVPFNITVAISTV